MLKNKRIFFISLVFLFFIFLNSSCFAYTEEEGYTDADVYNLFVYCKDILKENNVEYYDYCISNETKTFNNVTNSLCIYFFTNKDYTCYVSDKEDGKERVYCTNARVFLFQGGNFEVNSLPAERAKGTYYGLSDKLVYSSFHVKKSNGDIFFQCAPLVRLVPIMKQVEMGATIIQIIQLLPTILVVVVSFLGFRKALRILSKVLHQS